MLLQFGHGECLAYHKQDAGWPHLERLSGWSTHCASGERTQPEKGNPNIRPRKRRRHLATSPSAERKRL